MRFGSGLNSRLVEQERIEAARRVIFGHERGLPGERWFARPLVARDMLQWYFPSKYGLMDFRVDDYFQMQAERFQKRQPAEWVSKFRETVNEVSANEEKVAAFLKSVNIQDYQTTTGIQDLHSLYSSPTWFAAYYSLGELTAA